MSNNLVNQSTKAISTNELRWIGPVLAVVSSGPMDLFFFLLHHISFSLNYIVFQIHSFSFLLIHLILILIYFIFPAMVDSLGVGLVDNTKKTLITVEGHLALIWGDCFEFQGL